MNVYVFNNATINEAKNVLKNKDERVILLSNHNLEDLLFTLEVCKNNLPLNAHPLHYERLRYIEAILKVYFKNRKMNKCF